MTDPTPDMVKTIHHLVLAERALSDCREHLCQAFLSVIGDDTLRAAIQERLDSLWPHERPAILAKGDGAYYQFVRLALESLNPKGDDDESNN
jgi:hypothetical protein